MARIAGSVLGMCLAVGLAGCASNAPTHPSASVRGETLAPATAEEQRYGIRYQSMRLSGSGLLLDFRYSVLDADKAAHIVNHQVQPYVVDTLTGHQFQVPHAQKIGTLRHMGGKLQSGRVYSVLFANPGRTIKSGGNVQVVMGDYRLDALTVE